MTNCFLIVIYYHAYTTTTHFIYYIIWLRYYHAQDTLLLPSCGFQITANIFNLDHYQFNQFTKPKKSTFYSMQIYYNLDKILIQIMGIKWEQPT